MKGKMNYLDGLRTIFCAVVICHHFLMAFYPDVPIILFNDGNLAVLYFLVLSGFVMPLKLYLDDKPNNNIFREWLLFSKKRYLRLLPVVATTIFGSWIIQINGLYYTQAVSMQFNLPLIGNYYCETPISFWNMLYEAFVGSFIRRPLLNTPLWTIKYEFLIIIIVYIFVKLMYQKRNRIYIYAFLVVSSILCKPEQISCSVFSIDRLITCYRGLG